MCDNKLIYDVLCGYDYKEVLVTCGNTDPHGSRAVCDECYDDHHKMKEIERQEENIKSDNQWARSAGWGEF